MWKICLHYKAALVLKNQKISGLCKLTRLGWYKFWCCISHSKGLSSPSFGWCIRLFCSGVIIDSRLTHSPGRALSGGLLGLGISVLKILGFDRVNTCPWADGFEHSVNTASDYCKQILHPRGMGVKCFLAPESHLRGVKRIISRVFSQLWEVQTFPTPCSQSRDLIKNLCWASWEAQTWLNLNLT